MKILLVYPNFLEKRLDETDISALPMGLYYLGAMLLKHGHQVQLLNLYDPGTPAEAILPYLNKIKPDLVGFSIMHANRWGGIDMAAAVKQAAPDTAIVFGGIGATFLWRHLLTHFPQIDYVVTGEGELTLTALARLLPEASAEKLENVPGLAFRHQGRIVHTGRPDLIPDLDDLPNPAEYFTYQHLALTRGCPGNCAFCGSPAFWERRVRYHSTKYFVKQLRLLHEKGVNFFYISDDTLTLNKNRIIDICRTISDQRLAITWAAISRVDLVDADILGWMRKAGCVQISYGVESGSDNIRQRLNKRVSTSRIKEAFALTTRYGILPRAYFIYGSPGETSQTIQDSLDLIKEIRPLSLICYMLTLFPGTTLYRDFLKATSQDDDIWLRRIEDLPYFETDPGLTRSEVLSFGRLLRDSFSNQLPEFIDSIKLLQDEQLATTHADFLSRLAMTFTHGDYALFPHLTKKTDLAEKLYQSALTYSYDHRACLGLGMIYQQRGDNQAALAILEKGLEHYPDSEDLNICLGITCMNQGQFSRAIDCFRKFPQSEQARNHLATCRRLADKSALR